MQIKPPAGPTLERQFGCGLGQCRRCSCWAFKGGGNICEDCGHDYDDHTTKPFRSAVVRRNRNVVVTQESNSGGMGK